MKNNYFFLKVSLKSERGKKIQSFRQKCDGSWNRTQAVVKELGAAYYTEGIGAPFPGIGIGSLIFLKPQSKRAYKSIGRSGNWFEYVPRHDTHKGKEILKKILTINPATGDDACSAFNLARNSEKIPSWFILDGFVYLKSLCDLGQDYITISQFDYEEALKKKKENDSDTAINK